VRRGKKKEKKKKGNFSSFRSGVFHVSKRWTVKKDKGKKEKKGVHPSNLYLSLLSQIVPHTGREKGGKFFLYRRERKGEKRKPPFPPPLPSGQRKERGRGEREGDDFFPFCPL